MLNYYCDCRNILYNNPRLTNTFVSPSKGPTKIPKLVHPDNISNPGRKILRGIRIQVLDYASFLSPQSISSISSFFLVVLECLCRYRKVISGFLLFASHPLRHSMYFQHNWILPFFGCFLGCQQHFIESILLKYIYLVPNIIQKIFGMQQNSRFLIPEHQQHFAEGAWCWLNWWGWIGLAFWLMMI